jgi:F-type H+-transporting ATPase subunit epsilon
MNTNLDLKIYSPTSIILDESIRRLTFQGKEGYLTILPNHIDYISSFESNIMTYISMDNEKKFIALNSGILVKYADKIRITAYKAIVGDSISDLKLQLKNISEIENNVEKEINKNLKQLEYYMFNNLVNMK